MMKMKITKRAHHMYSAMILSVVSERSRLIRSERSAMLLLTQEKGAA